MVAAGLGREPGPETAECGAEVSGVPSNFFVTTAATLLVLTSGWPPSWWRSWANPKGNPRARPSPLSALPRSVWYRNAAAARNPLVGSNDCRWRTCAISFFGLARSDFCLSGRLSSSLRCSPPSGRASLDPADCAASFLGIIHSHFCSSSRCSTVFRARSVSCVHPKVQRRSPRGHVALFWERVTQFRRKMH